MMITNRILDREKDAVHTGQMLVYFRTLGLERPSIWDQKRKPMEKEEAAIV
jgi:hypothetical protein